MSQTFFTGLGRILLIICCFWLFSNEPVGAASFSLEQLEGKERLTFTMIQGEGLPGNAVRIEPKALIIPFTEVPSSLVFLEPLQGAKIIDKSMILGRSLAIETQTAEFGFVVVERKPHKLVIDFFNDPLGARWKAGATSPSVAKERSMVAPQAVGEQTLTEQNTTPVAQEANTAEVTPTVTSGAISSPQQSPLLESTPLQVVDAQVAINAISEPSTTTATISEPSTTTATTVETTTATPPNVFAPPAENPAIAAALDVALKEIPSSQELPELRSNTNNASGLQPLVANENISENVEQVETPAFLDSRRETSPRTAELPPLAPDDFLLGTQVQPDETNLAAVEQTSVVTASPLQTTASYAKATPPHLNTESLGVAVLAKNDSPAPLGTLLNEPQGDNIQSLATPKAMGNALPLPAPTAPGSVAVTSAGGVQEQLLSALAPPVPTPPVPTSPELTPEPVNTPTVVIETTQEAVFAPPYLNVEDEKLPVGSAVFTGPGITYRGRINLKGEEGVELPREIPTIASTQSKVEEKKNINEQLPVASSELLNENTPLATPAPTVVASTIPSQTKGAEENPLEATLPNTAQAEIAQTGAPAAPPHVTAQQPANLIATAPVATAPVATAQEVEGTQQGQTTSAPTESISAGSTLPDVAESATQGVAIPSSTIVTQQVVSKPVSSTISSTVSSAASGMQVNGTPYAPVVYVDEQGNPVAPPKEPEDELPEIRELHKNKQFATALTRLDDLLKQNNLNDSQREESLHLRAEILFSQSEDDFTNTSYAIREASNRAINFNQSSLRNAATLLRLGYMNLQLNNLPEAEAQFAILRRKYPDDENVPLTYYYWGDYYYKKGEVSRAADQFEYVVQNYAGSRFARESALGLARSFHEMGYYQQSYEVVEFIEQRWPRFYLDYPPFLNMMGDVAFRLNHLDEALRYYWLYANIQPQGSEADMILTRIGDIYNMQRRAKAAETVYGLSATAFPDKDGGLVAQMRLAESTINDDPNLINMFKVFDNPFDKNPVDVYDHIIKDYPQSALAPLAKLKLTMWYLWKKDYLKALDIATEFEQEYPNNELMPKVKEVALKTFATLASDSVIDGRYGRMRELWERYPIVQEQKEILSPESRIALGVSFWRDGNLNEALNTIDSFFLGNKVPVHSETALRLAISIYLEAEQWNAIHHVAEQVALWELTEETQLQLDYALALAAENLDENSVAAPLWAKLYEHSSLPTEQFAYVAYFLAKDAERNRDLEKAYLVGTDALTRLMQLVEDSPNQSDLAKIKSQLSSLLDISETAGRLNEALEFGQRFLSYLDPNAPERAGVELRMARIYKRQGNVDEWRRLLTELVKRDGNSIYGKTASRELTEERLNENITRYSPTGEI